MSAKDSEQAEEIKQTESQEYQQDFQLMETYEDDSFYGEPAFQDDKSQTTVTTTTTQQGQEDEIPSYSDQNIGIPQDSYLKSLQIQKQIPKAFDIINKGQKYKDIHDISTNICNSVFCQKQGKAQKFFNQAKKMEHTIFKQVVEQSVLFVDTGLKKSEDAFASLEDVESILFMLKQIRSYTLLNVLVITAHCDNGKDIKKMPQYFQRLSNQKNFYLIIVPDRDALEQMKVKHDEIIKQYQFYEMRSGVEKYFKEMATHLAQIPISDTLCYLPEQIKYCTVAIHQQCFINDKDTLKNIKEINQKLIDTQFNDQDVIPLNDVADFKVDINGEKFNYDMYYSQLYRQLSDLALQICLLRRKIFKGPNAACILNQYHFYIDRQTQNQKQYEKLIGMLSNHKQWSKKDTSLNHNQANTYLMLYYYLEDYIKQAQTQVHGDQLKIMTKYANFAKDLLFYCSGFQILEVRQTEYDSRLNVMLNQKFVQFQVLISRNQIIQIMNKAEIKNQIVFNDFCFKKFNNQQSDFIEKSIQFLKSDYNNFDKHSSEMEKWFCITRLYFEAFDMKIAQNLMHNIFEISGKIEGPFYQNRINLPICEDNEIQINSYHPSHLQYSLLYNSITRQYMSENNMDEIGQFLKVTQSFALVQHFQSIDNIKKFQKAFEGKIKDQTLLVCLEMASQILENEKLSDKAPIQFRNRFKCIFKKEDFPALVVDTAQIIFDAQQDQGKNVNPQYSEKQKFLAQIKNLWVDQYLDMLFYNANKKRIQDYLYEQTPEKINTAFFALKKVFSTNFIYWISINKKVNQKQALIYQLLFNLVLNKQSNIDVFLESVRIIHSLSLFNSEFFITQIKRFLFDAKFNNRFSSLVGLTKKNLDIQYKDKQVVAFGGNLDTYLLNLQMFFGQNEDAQTAYSIISNIALLNSKLGAKFFIELDKQLRHAYGCAIFGNKVKKTIKNKFDLFCDNSVMKYNKQGEPTEDFQNVFDISDKDGGIHIMYLPFISELDQYACYVKIPLLIEKGTQEKRTNTGFQRYQLELAKKYSTNLTQNKKQTIQLVSFDIYGNFYGSQGELEGYKDLKEQYIKYYRFKKIKASNTYFYKQYDQDDYYHFSQYPDVWKENYNKDAVPAKLSRKK